MQKTIEITSRTEEIDDEKLWLLSISKNPVFNFLNDVEEEIYSIDDGELFKQIIHQ